MASGVAVSDEVVAAYNDMKLRKSCSQEEKRQRKKFVFLRISPDKTTIIVDKQLELLVGDIGEKVPDPFHYLINMLPKDDCRYILYDAFYETNECKKEAMVFIVWISEDASIKDKMLYASSKDALKKKLQGIRLEVQATNKEDLMDRRTVAEKLGGCVIKLEGKPL
ncbi:cofilin-2-like [Rhinatrema bivittatum]|uniref:cofilin-2-like n=1 Tax=Rhinatrema bivittatum TaxID=194408 RepID=UPI00112ED682|nr:cofilin-2-like [Rhinatrema bivittatum]